MATTLPLSARAPINLDAPEHQRARLAHYATREYIAKCINEINKKQFKLENYRTGEAEIGSGFYNHIEPLFKLEKSPFLGGIEVDPYNLPDLSDTSIYPPWPPLDRNFEVLHVGIVGAGMAGLYTAMILKSLKVSYEIIEASDRIGGRVYTHRFTDDPGDYYDAGAMRFPDNPIMKRTFDLFDMLGILRNPDPDPKKQEQGQLIRYYLTGPETPRLYNNRRALPNDPRPDPFGAAKMNGGTVPNELALAGPGKITDEILKQWRADWAKDPQGTWERIKATKDVKGVTTRQEVFGEIRTQAPDVTDVDVCYTANWCETMNSSTCTYDQAFVENFIHSLDFNYPVTIPAQDPSSDPGNEWWCLNGGAEILAHKMADHVGRDKINLGTRVTGIERASISIPERPMYVQTDRSSAPRTYSHVITTTTLPCLQAMDLTKASLSYAQNEALRVLRYTPATKLGIKFSQKWWIQIGIVQGGQGKTDRPTRTVVYPSYALGDDPNGEGVLLACYNSSMDAARLGGLVRGGDPTNQPLVLDIVLRDLAAMHEVEFSWLRSLVLGHHFHDWSRYEFTSGAWGEFGPGQFSSLFGAIRQPAAGGGLYFAGELTSVYHGWIVAALKSAYRAVSDMLWRAGQGGLIEDMQKIWGFESEQEIITTDWLHVLGVVAAEAGI